MRFFRKPFRWAIAFSLALKAFSAFVLLDAFVIPRVGTAVIASASAQSITQSEPEAADDAADAVITATSYADENVQISIETVYVYDTAVYIADVQVSGVSYLKPLWRRACTAATSRKRPPTWPRTTAPSWLSTATITASETTAM